MAIQRIIKGLAGIEDLFLSMGTMLQTRGTSGEVTINGINATNIPFNITQSIAEYVEAIEQPISSIIVTKLAYNAEPTASYVNNVLTLGIPQGVPGDTGATGVGIDRVELTLQGGPSEENVYRLFLTDDTSYAFKVRNGDTATGIEATDVAGTPGYENIYTVRFSDGTGYPFSVFNGATDNDIHNNLGSIQGGTVDERYHLTAAELENTNKIDNSAVTSVTYNADGTMTVVIP